MNSLYFLIIHYETVLTNCHLNIVIFESFKSTRNDTKLMEASHIMVISGGKIPFMVSL